MCGLGGSRDAAMFTRDGPLHFHPLLPRCDPVGGIHVVGNVPLARAARAREVGRASFTLWISCLLGSILFFQFAMKGSLFVFALPVFVVAGLGVRAGMRRVRARIRTEEGDPLSRARRLN